MDKRLVEKKYFLWRMFTFSGYISPGQFWSEMVTRLISFFCASIILCMVVSVGLNTDTRQAIELVGILVPVLGVLWLIPITALTRRRLRDAGYTAKSYLWLLVPVIGWIVFVVRLCGRTVKRKPEDIWFEYD